MKKGNLVGIRISQEDVNLIDKAAEKDRRPRSQFMAKAALDKAKEILGDE